MFILTFINFLLFNLYTGTHVAAFVVLIRKVLILDIDYSLSEKELVNNVLFKLHAIYGWLENLVVSSGLSLLDCLLMIVEDITTQSHRHLEDLGPLPRPTVDNPHTVYSVDRSRG